MKVDIDKFRKEKQGDEINSIYDSLIKTSGESITSLPENVFVQNFLPLFAGENAPNNATLQLWLGIAGNPYMPVNIVDSKGEILYTVPAFFERSAIQIGKAGDTAAPIQHVIKTTEQLSKLHPRRGEVYFQEQMNRRNIVSQSSTLTDKNRKIWIDIFTRYNKPIPVYMVESKSESTDKKVESKTPTSSNLEYDDGVF